MLTQSQIYSNHRLPVSITSFNHQYFDSVAGYHVKIFGTSNIVFFGKTLEICKEYCKSNNYTVYEFVKEEYLCDEISQYYYKEV
jgi:hypothetical protein